MNVCEGLQVITGILLEGLVSCVLLSSCVKKKRKTFNPVTPKSGPQHKSTKIPQVTQKKFEKQDTDVCKNTSGVFQYIIAP